MDAQLTTYLQSMQAQGHPWESVKQLLVQSGYTPEQLQAAETFYLTGQVTPTAPDNNQSMESAKPASSKIAVLVIVIGLGALTAVGAGAFYLKNQASQPTVVVDTSTTVEEETTPQVDTQAYTKPLPQVDVMALATNPNALLDAVSQSLSSVTAYQYSLDITSEKEFDPAERAASFENIPNQESRLAMEKSLNSTFAIHLDVSVDQLAAEKILATQGSISYFQIGEAPKPEETQQFRSYQQGDRYLVREEPIPGVPENQMFLPPDQWIDTAELPPEYMVMADPTLMFKGYEPLNFEQAKVLFSNPESVTASDIRMIDGVECVKVVFSIDGTDGGEGAPPVEDSYTVWIGKQDALPREVVAVSTTDFGGGTKDISTKKITFTAYNQPPQIEEPTDVKQLSDLKRSE